MISFTFFKKNINRIPIYLGFFVLFTSSIAQKKLNYIDSSNFSQKKWTIGVSTALVYGSGFSLLYLEWYKKYPSSSFHFHNDLTQWNQSDKYGHIFTAYYQARIWNKVLLWGGMNEKKSKYFASGISFLAMNAIEVFDGISSQWGASASDIVANGIGAGLFLAQESIFHTQKIKLKYSYSHINYSDPILATRANELYGSNFYQQVLKNYNGTTLWFSASKGSIYGKNSKQPWIGIALGIGNGGMYGAETNNFELKNGNSYNYSNITRYRSLFISPDIDLEYIPTNKKWLKSLLFIANGIKLPLPTLEINTKGELNFYPFFGVRSKFGI